MRSQAAIWICALTTLAVVASASAQWPTAQRIELGGGLEVARRCSGPLTRGRWCLGWEPTGFVFGDSVRWLAYARVFGRVAATGRLLAIASPPTDAPRVLRSDDGGAHWVEVPWPSTEVPSVLAFDDRTRDGVAAGDGGHVWSTSDAGDHWTDHGGDARIWQSVAIADGEIALADSIGNVFRAHDGGFAREIVSTGSAAQLEQRDREIVVHTYTSDCTIRRGDGTRCVTR